MNTPPRKTPPPSHKFWLVPIISCGLVTFSAWCILFPSESVIPWGLYVVCRECPGWIKYHHSPHIKQEFRIVTARHNKCITHGKIEIQQQLWKPVCYKEGMQQCRKKMQFAYRQFLTWPLCNIPSIDSMRLLNQTDEWSSAVSLFCNYQILAQRMRKGANRPKHKRHPSGQGVIWWACMNWVNK